MNEDNEYTEYTLDLCQPANRPADLWQAAANDARYQVLYGRSAEVREHR